MADMVADTCVPLMQRLIGDSDSIPIRFWDGSTLGPSSDNPIVIESPDAIRRLVWAAGELGLARAYVSGEIDLAGRCWR